MKLTGLFSISIIAHLKPPLLVKLECSQFQMPYIADNHAIIKTCGDRFLAVAKKQNIPEVGYQAINARAQGK